MVNILHILAPLVALFQYQPATHQPTPATTSTTSRTTTTNTLRPTTTITLLHTSTTTLLHTTTTTSLPTLPAPSTPSPLPTPPTYILTAPEQIAVLTLRRNDLLQRLKPVRQALQTCLKTKDGLSHAYIKIADLGRANKNEDLVEHYRKQEKAAHEAWQHWECGDVQGLVWRLECGVEEIEGRVKGLKGGK